MDYGPRRTPAARGRVRHHGGQTTRADRGSERPAAGDDSLAGAQTMPHHLRYKRMGHFRDKPWTPRISVSPFPRAVCDFREHGLIGELKTFIEAHPRTPT